MCNIFSGEGGFGKCTNYLSVVSMPNVLYFHFHCVPICTTLLSLPLTITGLQSEKENHTQLQISKTQKGKQDLQLFIDPLSCGARNVCVVDGLHYTVVSSDF